MKVKKKTVQLELNDNLKGKCLIAMPGMRDEMFNHSVIYITEHSSISGAVGVIINKNLSASNRQLNNLEIGNMAVPLKEEWHNIPLYLGGPVEVLNGFVLQAQQGSSEWILSSGLPKAPPSGDENQEGRPLMLTIGYCMWESFQLEREVRFNNWLVVDNAVDYLLTAVPPTQRYKEALKLAGITNIALLDFNGIGYA